MVTYPYAYYMTYIVSPLAGLGGVYRGGRPPTACYPRRARSALGVDTVLTLEGCLYVCMYVCMYVRALERKRLIGMT